MLLESSDTTNHSEHYVGTRLQYFNGKCFLEWHSFCVISPTVFLLSNSDLRAQEFLTEPFAMSRIAPLYFLCSNPNKKKKRNLIRCRNLSPTSIVPLARNEVVSFRQGAALQQTFNFQSSIHYTTLPTAFQLPSSRLSQNCRQIFHISVLEVECLYSFSAFVQCHISSKSVNEYVREDLPFS